MQNPAKEGSSLSVCEDFLPRTACGETEDLTWLDLMNLKVKSEEVEGSVSAQVVQLSEKEPQCSQETLHSPVVTRTS